MTTQVNVQEAKTHLSRLLARAAGGEDIVIARDGTPLVRLVPVEQIGKRELGFMPAGTSIPDEVWDPLTGEELAVWHAPVVDV